MVFGELKVLKRVEDYVSPRGCRTTRWLVECSCNNKTIFSLVGSHLKNGHTKSCGHFRGENLSGKVFGMLTVLRFDNIKNKQTYWMAECSCSNKTIIFVNAGNLKRGHTKSCGCLSESYIASQIKEYFDKKYKIILEYKIFRNPETNHFLPFDIYIPENNIYIEIHGKQHYELDRFHIRESKENKTSPKDEFEYRKKKDRMKRKYARKNGIYIEIDLRKIKTVENGIKHIEKFLT